LVGVLTSALKKADVRIPKLKVRFLESEEYYTPKAKEAQLSKLRKGILTYARIRLLMSTIYSHLGRSELIAWRYTTYGWMTHARLRNIHKQAFVYIRRLIPHTPHCSPHFADLATGPYWLYPHTNLRKKPSVGREILVKLLNKVQ